MHQGQEECHIVTMVPFSDLRRQDDNKVGGDTSPNRAYYSYGYGAWPNAESLAKASYSLVAAAEMARLHFNTRDTAIVSELASLRNCSIRIEDPPITLTESTQPTVSVDGKTEAGRGSWYFDSTETRHLAIQHLMGIQERVAVSETNGSAVDAQGRIERLHYNQAICAVVGPAEMLTVRGIAVIADALALPSLLYNTLDHTFDDGDLHPNVVRLSPNVLQLSVAVAVYLQSRQFIFMLYENSLWSDQLEDSFEDAALEMGFSTLSIHFSMNDSESIHDALQQVLRCGYRTIMLVTERIEVVEIVANMANQIKGGELINGGYFWVLPSQAFSPAMQQVIRFAIDSPPDKLLRGAALFSEYSEFAYDPNHVFRTQWADQNASLVQRINSLVPKDPVTNKPFYQADASYFQTEVPDEYASYVYDSVIAAGMGACHAASAVQSAAKSVNATFLSAQERLHHSAILRSEFHGSSGNVSLAHETSNSRRAFGLTFGMYNIRPSGMSDKDPNLRGYEAVLTAVYTMDDSNAHAAGTDPVQGRAAEDPLLVGSWTALGPFLFFDGTTNQPLPLRTVADPNFMSFGVQVAGLTLAGAAVFLSLVTGVLVFRLRDVQIVKVGQPTFLYFLCLGGALVAGSLFFISFDERTGLADPELDRLCAAFPWFFVTGYATMYLALFSKLWRLSKLLQLRRVKVSVGQVMLPFALILTASFAVLIVWQILDPMEWLRVVVSSDPLETFGTCDSPKYGVVPFVVPLIFLNAINMANTSFMAWKLRNVQAELAESKWIFFATLTHIQIWLVGVPIVIITNRVSKNAMYLMFVCLGFIFSLSMVGLVIWSKLYICFRDTYLGGSREAFQVLNVSGRRNVRVSGLDTIAGQQQSVATSTTGVGGGDDVGSRERVAELEMQVQLLKLQVAEMKGGTSDVFDRVNAGDEGSPEEAPSPGTTNASEHSAATAEDATPLTTVDIAKESEEPSPADDLTAI